MAKSLPDWNNRIGRRLKLRDLQVLDTVVQWGSMARAASHLAMSQPAVSEAIAGLESALGVRLLDRAATGIVPTVYAHALLKRATVVFDELRQGIQDIEHLSNPAVGEVRIASSELFSAGLLPAAIASLSRKSPRVVVRVVQANTTTLQFQELRERTVDLVVARVHRPVNEADLVMEHLARDRHFVVAGTHSPWARRRKIDLSELADEAWVFPSTQVVRDLIAEAFNARGLEVPRERVTAGSILLRSQLLATGRFLDVLPDSVLRYNARQWSLKALPVDLGVEPRSIAMVTLRNRTVSPVVGRMMEHLRAASRAMFGDLDASMVREA